MRHGRGNLKLVAVGRWNIWLGTVFLAIVLSLACVGAPSIREYPTTLQCPECPILIVSRVIDGDTFDSLRGRVRLYGIDTPERGERCYSGASRGLKQLAGRVVRIEEGPRAADPGGRLLYYTYTEAGNSIDEILVGEGLARAWTRDGQHRDLLIDLESEARQRSTGCLW